MACETKDADDEQPLFATPAGVRLRPCCRARLVRVALHGIVGGAWERRGSGGPGRSMVVGDGSARSASIVLLVEGAEEVVADVGVLLGWTS